MARIHRFRNSGKTRDISKTSSKRQTLRSGRQLSLQEALGASYSFEVTHVPDGSFGVAALLDEIRNRLVSRGGRPADSGPTIRRLVPLRKQVWSDLKAEAEELSKRGKRVSPAQLAAVLVEKSLSKLKTR